MPIFIISVIDILCYFRFETNARQYHLYVFWRHNLRCLCFFHTSEP